MKWYVGLTFSWILFFQVVGLARIPNLIESLKVSQNKVQVIINKNFKKKYLRNDFFAEYDENINLEVLDKSIVIMPFLMNVISLVWISGKEYSIEVFDEELYYALERVREIFKMLYPHTPLNGKLIPKKLIKNEFTKRDDDSVALLFSGGLDSLCTSFKHAHLKQLLITAWGHADTPLDSPGQWGSVKKNIMSFAQRYGHSNTFIRSNYYAFLNKSVVNKLSPEIRNWRCGVVEGLGWFGLTLPVLISKGYKKLLIASSLSFDDPHPHAANPFVDGALKCAGIEVIHDGFELSRVDKCEYLVNFCNDHNVQKPFIRVCQKSRDGGNCCACIKCIQTIHGLWIAGADHHNYGFDVSIDEVIAETKKLLASKKLQYFKVWHFKCMQKRLRENNGQKQKSALCKELVDYFDWLRGYDFDEHLKNQPGADHVVDWYALAQRLSPVASVMQDIKQGSSIKVNNRVYEMQQQGERVTVLSLGEAFFDIPLFSFDCLPHPASYHYSHSRGIFELRQKLADYYKKAYNVPVDAGKEIIVTAGSKPAIYFALASVLNPGDEVIIHEPAWVSYVEQVRLRYATPVFIPHGEDEYAYEKYITKKTKVIIINNPSNPSGRLLKPDELKYLIDLAKKHNLYILVDEVYSDFVDGEKFYSLGFFDPEKKHSIICNSMSKNFGMSGWRIGYVISNAALIDQILKINQHLITCPATILEYYLAHYFDRIIEITKPQINAVVQKRNELIPYLNALGLSYLPGTAAFYFFVSIAPSKLSSEAFCMKLLDEEHISVVPGSGYGATCSRFIRISVGTESIENIKDALSKIKQMIEKTS